MASLHLRTGGLALARAELESLAGSGALDDEGLADLAEIRWRTGDLPGAGEAASAYLATGGRNLVGLVVAAEAQAGLGRPAEARRLVGRVLERAGESLEAVFAGMPRSEIWPHEAPEVGPPPATPTLSAATPTGPAATPAGAVAPPAGPLPVPAAPAPFAAPPPPAGPLPVPEPGLWDADPTLSARGPAADARAALEAGRGALALGDHATAALQLAVTLRLAPDLAPAVLDVIGETPGPGPGLGLVRGDALRLLGEEWDARRAYASVAALLQATRAGIAPASEPAQGAPRSPADGADSPGDGPISPSQGAGSPAQGPRSPGNRPRTTGR